jgi:hypothetical protein
MIDHQREDDINSPKPGTISTRDRVDEIFSTVKESQAKFERFATRTIVLVSVIFIMSGIAIAGFALALKQERDNRRDNLVRACRVRNEQNQAIQKILIHYRLPESEISLFNVVPDCLAYARAQLK